MTRAEAAERAHNVFLCIMQGMPYDSNFDRHGAEVAIAAAIYELHQARPDLKRKKEAADALDGKKLCAKT